MATVNKDFRVKNGLVVEGTTATVNGNDILTTVSTIGSDSVTEGSTNLFFTDARARAALGTGQTASANISNLIVGTLVGVDDQLSIGGSVSVGGGLDAGFITVGGEDVLTASSLIASTDELSEGTSNLYFTDARAIAAVEGASFTSLSASTVNISEMSIDGATGTIASAGSFTIDSASSITLDASDAFEGSINLNSNIEGGVYINSSRVATQTYVNTAVSNLVDSAPGTLDTLNELAAALGDDPNFATTVTASIGEKVAKSGDTMTGFLTLHANPESNLHAATKQYVDSAVSAGVGDIDSDDVPEGATNLYFTDARAVSAVEAETDLTLNTVSISGFLQQAGTNAAYALQSYVDSAVSNATLDSTDELSEGTTNLYFTDARAVSAIVDETIEPRIVTLKSTHPDNYSKTYILQHDNFEGGPQNLGTIAGSAAKIIVTAVNKNTGDIEVTEVLAAKAGGNVYVTEYANVTTGNDVGSVTVTEVGGSMQLNYTGANFDMLSVTAHVTDLIVDLTN